MHHKQHKWGHSYFLLSGGNFLIIFNSPKNKDMSFEKARDLMKENRFPEALREYEAAANESP